MASKKVSELTITTSLAENDVFVVNHLGSTNKVAYSTLVGGISSTVSQNLTGSFIKLPPSPTAQQVLTYNGSTSTWVASAVPAGGGGVTLPTGTNGQVLTYNGSTSTWVASAVPAGGSGGIDATPIGSVCWLAASSAPTGYLECSGGEVSQSLYSDLYIAIGTAFNTGGEGVGNFRLPDLRGEFIRGWDHGRDVDTGRTFGQNQEYTTARPKNTNLQRLNSDGSLTTLQTGTNNPSQAGFARVVKDGIESFTIGGGANATINELDVVQVVGGDSETRPRNVALLPCIKAVKTVTGTVQSLNFIEKPASATGQQILTYNGSTSTWVASAAPAGGSGGGNIYTTVGNASAGIFTSAVCFIPSDPGTGTWTAPAGCYTARVTIVGGGGGGVAGGSASRFNYTTGGVNQLIANGGGIAGGADGNSSTGGSASWNGINVNEVQSIYSGMFLERANSGGGGIGGSGHRGILGIGDLGSSYEIPGFAFSYQTLSHAAMLLSNLGTALYTGVGAGNLGGGGGGWCSAIVYVTPSQSYTYSVGVRGDDSASHGMVVIEW